MKRIAVLAVASAMLSGTAGAYTLLVPTMVWQVTPVGIEINANKNESTIADVDYGHTAVVTALNDVATSWNQVASITTTTNIAGAYVFGDGTPTITFNDPPGYCTMGCLAVTLTSYYVIGNNNYIADADMFVSKKTSVKFTSELEDPNVATCGFSEYYIEGVLMHEAGHAIGLDHSAVAGATMAAFANTCDQGAADIAADDIAGADFLY